MVRPAGIHDTIRDALETGGVRMPSARRSLWIHGDTPLDFDGARALIRIAGLDRPHVRIVVTSTDPRTRQFLRARFPDDRTLPMPAGTTFAFRRFIRALQVKHLMLLDGGRTLPPGLIRSVTDADIPVSVVNIGTAAAVHRLVIEESARQPRDFRFCAHDDVADEELRRAGVPEECLSVTGCLDLDAERSAARTSAAAAARALGVDAGTRLVAALDVPVEEESMVFDAFAGVRQHDAAVRLLVDPHDPHRAHSPGAVDRLRRDAESRGWTVAVDAASPGARDRPWDVLIASPGEAIDLMSFARTVIVGGTFEGTGRGAVVAAAIGAGARALVGPRHEFADVPWRRFACLPFVGLVRPANLASACVTSARDWAPRHDATWNTDSGAALRTHAAISAKLPDSPDLPAVAQDWKVPTWRDRAGRSRVWRAIGPAVMGRRIDSWPDLAARLRHPRSVLCLGNGPTSEDPRLIRMAHDCLMRVNWRWQARGAFTNPDVVFAGDPATMQRVSRAVFGFWNEPIEQGMLLRRLVTRGPRPIEYFTMDRISTVVRDRAWPDRPTNGALMIAAAAALGPDRLIVAGVDLFLHPDGRYPGDLVAVNDYARAHSRRTDLAIIRSALAGYHGDVVIVSDCLREALEARDVTGGPDERSSAAR